MTALRYSYFFSYIGADGLAINEEDLWNSDEKSIADLILGLDFLLS